MQGQFTKFETADGRLVMINDAKVLCVEVFSEENKADPAINPHANLKIPEDTFYFNGNDPFSLKALNDAESRT